MWKRLIVLITLVLATGVAAATVQSNADEVVTETVTLNVDGMTCSTCELRLERSLTRHDGVLDVDADLDAATATITYDPEIIDLEGILEGIRNAGFEGSRQQ